ncbi:MAG: YfjI family protein [Leptospirillum sp.]
MGKDFNDIALGILENPVKPGDTWPDPEPLEAPDDPMPYPLKALPDGIRESVEEVLSFTQAPPALAACSALSALSVAAQGSADVRRNEGLEGPVSLYFLVIAESGERKSSVDGHFMARIREWELEQAKAAKPLIAKYRASFAAWDAEKRGLLDKIKKKPTQELKDKLQEHEQIMPECPLYPELIHHDSTPEALSSSLAHQWPSGAIISSEAGIVLGGHGMGRESISRSLALLNELWDGIFHRVKRKTGENYTIRGARLTMGLATQKATIQEFFEASKGLARGTGFMARFLIAWPESTQGTRFWKDAPPSWPNLTRFQHRLVELLDKTPLPDGDNGLDLPVRSFTNEGQRAWIDVYNEIEADLGPDGDLSTLRDVASKAADNIARLAALFSLYGNRESIGADEVSRAAQIVVWHLHESKRFFGEIKANPQDLLAAKLDSWFITRKESRIPKGEIQKHGPNALRKKNALDRALIVLMNLNRIRMRKEGKGEIIEINPALIEGGI